MKVARSVIEELDGGTDAEAIVAAITGPGRSLTMTITAEGVRRPGRLIVVRVWGAMGLKGFCTLRLFRLWRIPGFWRGLAGSDVAVFQTSKNPRRRGRSRVFSVLVAGTGFEPVTFRL